MPRRIIRALIVFCGLVAAAAAAAEGSRGTPGEFDFYVLSLSWSPSYCEAEGDPREPQCRRERPPRRYAFVVHGLWPQYERGWPQFCDPDPDWVPRRQIDDMLDIVPNPRLVIHQWKKHGTCSGLDVAGYFDLIRAARGRIAVPPQFDHLGDDLVVAPAEVEAAFRRANPGLGVAMISVSCDRRRLREVLICMDRDLRFRDCPALDRRACRRKRVVMPPVR